jgi:hypothetical protein
MGGKIVAGLVGLVVVIVIAAVIEYAGLALGYEAGYLTAMSDRYVHTLGTADPNKLTVQQRQSIVTDANATYRLHLFLAGGRVQVDNRQATQQAMDEVSKILRAWIGSPPPRTLVH